MKLTQNDNIERNMQIEESLVKDRQVKDGRVKESDGRETDRSGNQKM